MTRSAEMTVADVQTVVGPAYAVRDLLRSCAFGDVFRARDAAAGREVTVTIVRAGDRCMDDCLDAITAGVRRSVALAHPGILAPLVVERRGRDVYYVTPFVAAGTLEDLLGSRKVIGLDRVLAIVGDVAAALDYAHEQGVVHRALVPSDITLDRQEHAHVSNFGVQASLRETAELTHGHGAALVQAYAAPEHWRGHALDARADQYSLAVIAYELLAGVRRLDAVQVGGIQTLDPIEVSAFTPLRPGLGLHVNAALRTALSASPSNRFPTTTAFWEALAGRRTHQVFASHQPTRARSGFRSGGIVVGTLAGLGVAAGTILVLPDARDAALGMARSVRLSGIPGLRQIGLSVDLPAGTLPSASSGASRTLRMSSLDRVLPSNVTPSAGTRAGGGGNGASGYSPGTGGSSARAPGGSAGSGTGAGTSGTPSGPTGATRGVDLPGTRLAARVSMSPPAPNATAEQRGWVSAAVANARAIAGRAATSVGVSAPTVQLPPAAPGVSSPVPPALSRATTGGARGATVAPASDAPSRASGSVSVAVRGGGVAIVLIDGIPRGTAPLTSELSAGRHTVTVRGAGRYEPASTVVTVPAGGSASAVFTAVP